MSFFLVLAFLSLYFVKFPGIYGNMGKDTSELMSAADVSAYLGVTTRTLGTYRDLGTGPGYITLSVRAKPTIRYRRDVVEAWLNGNTHTTTADESLPEKPEKPEKSEKSEIDSDAESRTKDGKRRLARIAAADAERATQAAAEPIAEPVVDEVVDPEAVEHERRRQQEIGFGLREPDVPFPEPPPLSAEAVAGAARVRRSVQVAQSKTRTRLDE